MIVKPGMPLKVTADEKRSETYRIGAFGSVRPALPESAGKPVGAEV